MPDNQDSPNGQEQGNALLNRRRVLQLATVGMASGVLGSSAVSAASDTLPNTIYIDGSVGQGTATYNLLVTEAAEPHPDIGGNQVNQGHTTGTVESGQHAYNFRGGLSHLDVEGIAEVTLEYGTPTEEPDTSRLEIVAGSDTDLEYTFTSSDTVQKGLDNGNRSANDGDTVMENDDGTWSVDGSTANGSGDTYDLVGDLTQFEPVTGDFTIFLDGQEKTVTELTGQEVPDDGPESPTDRAHSYSFEATGDSSADYYLEVEDGGAMIPSTVNDAIVEADFHWINEDGTKAAGRIDPGEKHAFAFDTLVADVTIQGEATARVDGSRSNLEIYPQDSASGDHWKGYFPWQISGEERTHTYSFESTGDSFVDYYLEVQDGGAMIPSTINDAIVEYEFFWISADGTKAAGRIDPGEKHAFAFDTLVADVTIQGEASARVNGSLSNLDIYPQETATGDGWKSGFPWQDADEGVTDDSSTTSVGIRHDRYEGPVGGGDGMPQSLVHDGSNADLVVSNGDVDGALNNASAGDLIYVEGSASGFTVDVPDVTVAGNRGFGDDGRITSGVTVTADNVSLSGLTISPGSGMALRISAQYPEFFNCAFRDASNKCIRVRQENTASTFTQCRFDNWSGYGFHNNFNDHDEAHKNVLEYCEFSDLGRHCVNIGNAWYHIRDCHTHGSIGLDPDHFIEVRAPNKYGVDGSAPVACGSPCGNAIVEHNRHELSGGTEKTRLIVVRGEPTDGVWVENNRAPGNAPPSGGCWEEGTHGNWETQIVMQNASSTSGFSETVHISNNER